MRQWLDRLPTKVKPKALGEHATTVARHHKLLRQLLHRVEQQLHEEGINVPLDVIVAECVFAKNALTTIGNTTPYQGLLGRTPPILKVFELLSETMLDDLSGCVPGCSRHHMRAREIAVEQL